MLETVFEWVVSTTIRASLVAAAILAIQMLLKPWLPAKWRHPLWLPLLLVMILPFVPALPVHIIPARPAPVASPARASQVVPPAPAEITAVPTTSAVAPSSQQRLPLLPSLWLAGVLVTMTAGILGYRSKLKAIRRDTQAPPPDLQVQIEDARKAAGLSKTPLVWLSHEVESPAVSGFLRPVLLLPAGFPAAFTATEARLILLHEFSHIKRHDLAQNWLLFALQSLHWFNPVIWFAFARVRLDRETACDARVLALDTLDRRSDYGHALLKMQELPAVSGLRLGFLGIFESASGIRSRITDISRYRHSHPAWQVAGCVLVAAVALFGATKAEEARPRQAEPLSGVAYIKSKLDKITIPEVKFADTSMEEAIDFIRKKSVELDSAELDPGRKGINFVIRKPRVPEGEKPKETPRITLEKKDINVFSLLAEVAKQTGTRFKIDDFAVTFVPADEKDPVPLTREEAEARAKASPPPSPKTIENYDIIRNIVIPTLEFEDVSLTEAVETLNARAAESAKPLGKTAPKIRIGPSVKGDPRIKELRLRNVPLADALRYCAESVRSKFTVDDEGVQFVR